MHKNEEKMWNLSELILINILIYANGYDIKCPHSSQWNSVSKSYGCSEQKIYICLLNGLKTNDTNTVYKEKCGPADISKEGSKYILKPDLDPFPCAAGQYQPFPFTTNGNSQCVFGKSLCKSSGQVLANNGTSSTDISCRCNYRQNYDYVTPPKDPCFCKPAEEDCSCYIRKCKNNKIMIADYRCMKRVDTILPEDIKCPIISRIIPPEEADTVYRKQFQPVSDSGTWSMQASAILIVLVIIYTVLIGFLFFSVPNVTSILLKSKLELSLKRKENEFMILNGDKVKIECNVKSYIPVRSVTWQKEIEGEIIQITTSEDKYKIDFMNRPSLTIDNFNAGDQGKYRCIVKNVVGLRNEICGSCMHSMSRFGWLTGFVSVLQHIPAFHTEDITLHIYDSDSQPTPTVYNVFKGADVTMEHHINDQQKLIAIKWFKESGNGTELDLSNEQYSGGVPEVPSLTIKATRMENAGIFFCLLIYDNGEIQKTLFKLKIIPQVKIYKDILEQRKNKTFIRPAIVDTIDKHMHENNIVVIAGREGTGKSSICLELASCYEEKDYTVFRVDLSENHSIYTDIDNALLIIDDQQYIQESLGAFMKHLLPVLSERNIKVIMTCRNLDLDIVKMVPEINTLNNEAFIDINRCSTAEEKESMISRYLQDNNIATARSEESNFRDPNILTDLTVQVKLDMDAIKIIKNEEPWKGFPLSLSLFCSDRNCLHLGEKYFTNPPRHLVEELKELYKTARKTPNCIDKINDYCVLVYTMHNKNQQLDLNDPNLCSQLDELYHTFFHFKNKPEKPGSNEDQKIAIKEAVHRMNNKYLKFHEGVYEFIHPCLVKAMFLSAEHMVHFLLTNGSLHDITEFVRSEDYIALERELVVKIGSDYHYILCETLVRHAFENHSLMSHVAQYIYLNWRSPGVNLVNKMFNHIEFIMFRSLEVHIGDPLFLDNDSLAEKSPNCEGSVIFSNVILLADELTYKGRDPWIYGPGTADFLILSALISSAIGRYATNRVQTFKILLEEFHSRIHLESFVKLLSKPLDIHRNTFFHYLMLFSEMEASEILKVNEERKNDVLDTENVKKCTPIDIAAFLGKRNILKYLNMRINFTKKLRDRLKRLAERGRDEFYTENTKTKNIDQPMVHKTMHDSTSCGDADDVKMGVKDEIKKTFSFRKKEKQDKNDILCFEDFITFIIVMGGKEDYQSIIEQL